MYLDHQRGSGILNALKSVECGKRGASKKGVAVIQV